MQGLDHIGIAVRDLRAARAAYEALGLGCSGVREVPSEQVRVAMFPLGGSRIELLESTSQEGVIAKFISKRGEGLHHICLQVGDLEATLTRLRQGGFRLVGEAPRKGAGDGRVAFVHPSSASGVLIEFREGPGGD